MARAKIVATIGPASRAPETLRALLLSGVNVARINMSHGGQDEHAQVITTLRTLAAEINLPLAILMDLCGPKIRTGKLHGGGPVLLQAGAHIILTPEEILGTSERVTCSYAQLAYDAKPGDRILIDDGLIEMTVTKIQGLEVECLVINGGPLNERKGVNLPSIPTSLPSLTEKDKNDLRFGIAMGVDFIALSFVRRPEDCQLAKTMIAECGASTPLIAKIEKPEALAHLDTILDIVDGVMVARGDLGVEAETERVPIYQKEIIRHANRKGKIVITATQMLQSMVENPRPTRAEASDVANAILDGSDAVMLSAESAAGAYPVESVRTMRRIIDYTEEATAGNGARAPETAKFRRLQTGSSLRALSEAALFAAEEISAKLIVVYTEGGKMARSLALLRPPQRIVAITHYVETYRQLSAVWGVEPLLLNDIPNVQTLFTHGDELLLHLGWAKRGERLIVLAGKITGLPVGNLVHLHVVGE
jgi:pyruvate kinase